MVPKGCAGSEKIGVEYFGIPAVAQSDLYPSSETQFGKMACQVYPGLHSSSASRSIHSLGLLEGSLLQSCLASSLIRSCKFSQPGGLNCSISHSKSCIRLSHLLPSQKFMQYLLALSLAVSCFRYCSREKPYPLPLLPL